VDKDGERVLDEDNLPILIPNIATFTKTTIPNELITV
jgi:hypothetical protein